MTDGSYWAVMISLTRIMIYCDTWYPYCDTYHSPLFHRRMLKNIHCDCISDQNRGADEHLKDVYYLNGIYFFLYSLTEQSVARFLDFCLQRYNLLATVCCIL